MSDDNERPGGGGTPGSIGYVRPPQEDPVSATAPDTGSDPTGYPLTSNMTPAPVAPEPPRELELSDTKLEDFQDAAVAVLLARRQRAITTGQAPGDLVSPAEVLPGGGHFGRSLRRSIPVAIYLENDKDRNATRKALRGLLEAFDIEVAEAWPQIRGSWFRSFRARTRRRMTSPEFRAHLAKLERALELQVVHKAQAEVDAAQGRAVAELITSLTSTPNAMIQAGSLLVIKIDGEIIVRNLTQAELLHLERNPALLRAPTAALHELQSLNAPAAELAKP
jgi:hypothetical protein